MQTGPSNLAALNVWCALWPQVWNMNAVNGVVMVANVQGSTWDRRRHSFATHDACPAPLQAIIRPQDVAELLQLQDDSREAQCFAMYSDRSEQLMCCDDGLEVNILATVQPQALVAPASRIFPAIQSACTTAVLPSMASVHAADLLDCPSGPESTRTRAVIRAPGFQPQVTTASCNSMRSLLVGGR